MLFNLSIFHKTTNVFCTELGWKQHYILFELNNHRAKGPFDIIHIDLYRTLNLILVGINMVRYLLMITLIKFGCSACDSSLKLSNSTGNSI